jgi:ribosomal protein S18 acetylase RimI-like enzyme
MAQNGTTLLGLSTHLPSVDKHTYEQGLAKRLLDHLVEHARQEGFEKVVLTTGQHMPQANTMYHSYGFTKVKEDPIVVWYEYVLPKAQ